jgi:MFS family permease
MLLAAASVSGLVGAPMGGWFTDRIAAKETAVVIAIVSSIGLLLVLVALASSSLSFASITKSHVAIRGSILESNVLFFSVAVMLLSRGVTAHGPALTQQYSPPGAEVTSLSLVKAAVDAKYIVACFAWDCVRTLYTLEVSIVE